MMHSVNRGFSLRVGFANLRRDGSLVCCKGNVPWKRMYICTHVRVAHITDNCYCYVVRN